MRVLVAQADVNRAQDSGCTALCDFVSVRHVLFSAIEFLFRVNIETAERRKALGSSRFSQRGA